MDVIRLKEGKNKVPVSVEIYREDIDEIQYEVHLKNVPEMAAKSPYPGYHENR